MSVIRTQIQLPDELLDRAKKVCEAREISLDELSRRGLEYILSVYPPEPVKLEEWSLPKPRHLGWQELSDSEIKAHAQQTINEVDRSHPADH